MISTKDIIVWITHSTNPRFIRLTSVILLLSAMSDGLV